MAARPRDRDFAVLTNAQRDMRLQEHRAGILHPRGKQREKRGLGLLERTFKAGMR